MITQGTLAREHVSMQGTLVREHESTQGTLAREHARHIATWACKHSRHVGTWALKARNLADSVRKSIIVLKKSEPYFMWETQFYNVFTSNTTNICNEIIALIQRLFTPFSVRGFVAAYLFFKRHFFVFVNNWYEMQILVTGVFVSAINNSTYF